ncbi:unnamed protein product [Effrenium voratum]|uniref:Uncharacterized protein n=1 Tax=Effrenium voratum TaxID=2562239 RepID=A0AA36JJU6_9DINO|nr:unnamed protein product [Effrenium voratum]
MEGVHSVPQTGVVDEDDDDVEPFEEPEHTDGAVAQGELSDGADVDEAAAPEVDVKLDGASEVACALAAMMSAVGGLQKSFHPPQAVLQEPGQRCQGREVEAEAEAQAEAQAEAEAKEQEKVQVFEVDQPGGLADILAGLKVAMNNMQTQDQLCADERTQQDVPIEELEDRLLLQKVLLKQLRADYEARLERSNSMQKALDELGTDPREMQVKVVRAKDAAANLCKAGDQAAMRAEDFLGRGHRLYESRRKSHEVAVQLAKESEEDLAALRRSRGHVSEEVAAEVLKEQQRRIELMRQDAKAQDEKLLALGADLRSVLDFMVRVNIDSRGGPSRRLAAELAPELRQLGLTEVGKAQLAELLKKYEVYLERYSQDSTPGLLESAVQASAPAAALSAAQMQRRPPPPLPNHETRSASFSQERQLLRSRLVEEMHKVAAVLANDATMPRGEAQACQHEEMLRAAAWGELRTLQEILRQKPAYNERLCGWTAWHSAAAHGQEKVMAFLAKEAPEAVDAAAKCGLPALGIACLRGHVESARCLVRARCCLERLDIRGNGPLHWAAASYSDQVAQDLAELLLQAGADPFACNGSGQLPDIAGLQDLALVTQTSPKPALPQGHSSGGAALAVRQQPKRKASRPPSLADTPGTADGEVIPNFSYIRVEKANVGSGLLSTLSMLKPPVRDRAGIMRTAEARRLVHLSPEEEDFGLWSDWVTNFTHAGLEHAVSTDEPPSCDPTNAQRNTQALVLTSERLIFLRCTSRAAVTSGWSVAQGVPLAVIRQLILPRRSDTLLLLRLRDASDELLNFPSRDAFLEELWQAMVRAGWPGRHVGENDNLDEAPKDFVVVDPDPVIPLLDLSDEREAAKGTLAFLQADLIALLPRCKESLLLTAETARFGFLELQRRTQPKQAGAGVCWQWQKFFFLLKARPPCLDSAGFRLLNL